MKTTECSSVILCDASVTGWEILSLDTSFSVLSGAPSVPGRLLDSLLYPAPTIDAASKIRQTVHWFRHAPSLPPVTLTATALPGGTYVSHFERSAVGANGGELSRHLISCHFIRHFASSQPLQALRLNPIVRPVSIYAFPPDLVRHGSSALCETSHDLHCQNGYQQRSFAHAAREEDLPGLCVQSEPFEPLQCSQPCSRRVPPPPSHNASLGSYSRDVNEILSIAVERRGDGGAHCHPYREACASAPIEPRRASASISPQSCNTAFLANTLSHELRTPLNGIVALTELLLSTSLTPEQRDLLNTVLESGQSLTRILSSIIDFSQLHSGLVELTPGEFNVCDVIESCIDMVQAEAASKGVVVSSTLPREAMASQVIGDSLRIRQVLVHLLSNAVKFTEIGHVEVVVRAKPADGSLGLVVEVIDTGVGIPEAFKPRLFDGFTQASDSCTRVHGGMGLGLAISGNLAELMGAKLSLDSEEGKGTTATFMMHLPLAPNSTVNMYDADQFSASAVMYVSDSKGEQPSTSNLGNGLMEDASSTLHMLLREKQVLALQNVTAVVYLEHIGLQRQLQAMCEALGMSVRVAQSMLQRDAKSGDSRADSHMLFCSAAHVSSALRCGWKRRPIVALCINGQLPHMLRVHAAALAAPVKVRELVVAVHLALSDSPRRASLLVPLGRPKTVAAAAAAPCTAGFGHSPCGFCNKCHAASTAEADAARKRISLDNSALEKIPRKLSQQVNTLSRCSEDSYTESATTSASEVTASWGAERKVEQLKASSSSMGGSHGSMLHDLAMDEYTTSTTSHGSADTNVLTGGGEKVAEAGRPTSRTANQSLHSHRLSLRACRLDASPEPATVECPDVQQDTQQQGGQVLTYDLLRADPGRGPQVDRRRLGVLRQAHEAQQKHIMRRSFSATDIAAKAQENGNSSTVAMQSFLYQPVGLGRPGPGMGGEAARQDAQARSAAGASTADSRQIPAPQTASVPPETGHGRALRILIAEDNKINQLVTKKVVCKVRPSCEIDVVSDGEAALLTILERPEYDLVLMDLHMPRMDGLEATRRVRERHPLRPLIVALTADTVIGTRQKCLQAGMDEYISKPFHVKDMQRILHMCG